MAATVSKEWEPETVFDVFGSALARQILALASVKPMSVNELQEHCDASEPTIYRRVNALVDYDLLAEETELDADGNHYKTFETKLQQVCFEIEEGGFNVEIQLRQDLVDRFGSFWEDLERSTHTHTRSTNDEHDQ